MELEGQVPVPLLQRVLAWCSVVQCVGSEGDLSVYDSNSGACANAAAGAAIEVMEHILSE